MITTSIVHVWTIIGSISGRLWNKFGFSEAVGWFVEVRSGLRRGSFAVHGPEPPKKRPIIVPKSSRNCSENRQQSVPEAPKTVQIASPRPSQRRFLTQVPKKCVSDDFLTVFGRFWGGVLGAQIVPKSIKMASVKRFIFHPFSDLRFHLFSTHFWSKNVTKIDVFPGSEARSPTLQNH